MDFGAALRRNAPWRSMMPSHAESECDAESEKSEQVLPNSRASSPALPKTPSSNDPGSADDADCATTFRVVEYAVKNTFIDVSDSDSEPDTASHRFRVRAHTDGDFQYGSPINRGDSLASDGVMTMCASNSLGLSEAETASLASPACPDMDEQQPASDGDEETCVFEMIEEDPQQSDDLQYRQTHCTERAQVLRPSIPMSELTQMSLSTSVTELPQNQIIHGLPVMWMPTAVAWSQRWAPIPIATIPSISQSLFAGASPTAAQLKAVAAQLEAAAKEAEAAAARARQAAERSASPTQIATSKATENAESRTRQAAERSASPAGVPASSARCSPTMEEMVDDQPTTVMLRNLPNDYTRDLLLQLMDDEGFKGKYDFIYMPIDFNRGAGLGYAFINLVTHEDAGRVRQHFEGFKNWAHESPKVCEVAWGEPLQGLVAHVERFKNSPVMHGDVPDEYKPALFESGVRMPFPAPTKKLRPPRLKHRPNAEASHNFAAHSVHV